LFGTLWAVLGIEGLKGLDENWLAAGTILVGFTLLGGGISLIRASRQFLDPSVKVDVQARQRRSKWFRMIFATELILIGIASVICRTINRFDLFIPVTMLIVGIHFFPLAAVFKLKIYYLAGALLCSLVIITLLAVPERLRLGNLQISAWWVVLGFCAALILWGSGFANWLHGKKLLDQKKE
jgi:hypothetical protein